MDVPEMPRVFPRRLPSTSRAQRRARALRIARVVATNFAPALYRRLRGRPLPEHFWVRPLRRTFDDLGTTFLKYGQLIGSAPGVFGDGVADEFRSCLDTGPLVPFETVRAIVEDELGMPLGDAFESFDPEPIGRASIAVVHRAITHDGRAVAVKVLRPAIERRVAVDLDLLQPMLELLARQTGDPLVGSLLQMFEGFRLQLGEELDLRNEARAMTHYRELLEIVDLPLITVPEVHPELSGSRVLTMELLDGVPIDDVAAIEELGIDPTPVVEQTVQGFLLTAIRWGNFHGDVHAGNLLLLRDGRVGVIDWGIVARLDPDSHRFFRRMIEAALGDETAWPDIAAHIHAQYGAALMESLALDEEQLTVFVRGMMEPLLTAPFGEVSLAAVLQAPDEQVARARGFEAQSRSLGATFKRIREQRRVRAMAEQQGVVQSDWDRSSFLLSKQLMYFERYGKLYLSDRSLFQDQEFFRAALAEPIDGSHPPSP
jgi:predicted unusual protein kinase regulating ubiquinone biosynthesis (AarF/ABC1/UbiB family)